MVYVFINICIKGAEEHVCVYHFISPNQCPPGKYQTVFTVENPEIPNVHLGNVIDGHGNNHLHGQAHMLMTKLENQNFQTVSYVAGWCLNL